MRVPLTCGYVDQVSNINQSRRQVSNVKCWVNVEYVDLRLQGQVSRIDQDRRPVSNINVLSKRWVELRRSRRVLAWICTVIVDGRHPLSHDQRRGACATTSAH